MNQDSEEIDGKVAQSVEFLLWKRLKMVLRMREDHRFRMLANELVKHLRLCSYRFFRKRPDYGPRSSTQALKGRDDEQR